MTKEYSPFTPGVPVPIEFFVGREKEITDIVKHVSRSIAKGSLERIFISGERGIGKSSLCRMAARIAEEKHDVLALHVFLGGVKSLEEMVRRIFERLIQESRDRSWFEGVKQFLGHHVKEVGLFGVSLTFEASPSELARAASDLGASLRKLLAKITQRKGLLIILDDLNGLATMDQFANWIKSFVDEIATARDPLPLTLMLAGIPERRRQLIERQPSLDRVFDLIDINPFNEQETRDFFRRTLNRTSVTILPLAEDLLWRFSGGYPVFLHEIGDAVFKSDSDGEIDFDDAVAGIMLAARVIGAKYIEPNVLDAIWSERYRGILKKVVSRPFEHQFSKSELQQRISVDEAKVLDNFLQKMKLLDVIRPDAERGRGHYRFASELYAMFFWLQAAADPRAQSPRN